MAGDVVGALQGAGLDHPGIMAPNARIDRPRRFDSARVMKADQFMEKLNNGADSAPALTVLGNLNRTRMSDSIADIAHKLIALHRPSTADTLARFGLRGNGPQAQAQDCESDPAPLGATIGSAE